ncbi:MAG: DUF1501 domain-containing protein, partial [Thermoanaerobaculia bacterium]
MSSRMTRRRFVSGTALAVIGATLTERSAFGRIARAAGEGDTVLVVLFLRGGADGLALCPPHGDSEYYRVRPTIALPPPGSGSGSVLDLDGYFGLHPALAPLKPFWDDGQLGIVHAVGNDDVSRSHFDAQEFVETGTPGVKGSNGFLARCLDPLPGIDLMEAVAFSRLRPRALQGPQAVLVAEDLSEFDFRATGWRAEAEDRLDAIYRSRIDDVGALGTDSLDAIRRLKITPVLFEPPANGAVYPDSVAGDGLRQAARIITAEMGTRCIFIDVEGDFDTHSAQVVNNQLDFEPIGLALAAFGRDLGTRMDRVVVLVVTEFGRAVYETGAAGTDHGTAGAMIAFGGPVAGGHVHGTWPGLLPHQLRQARDLAVTTDFR